MGVFIYNSHSEGTYHIDVMHFDKLPEGFTPFGENPNLTVRSYLTGDNGECIPMYEFIGDRDVWSQTLINPDKAAPGDGNVLKFIAEAQINGGVLLTPGELLVEDGQVQGYAPLDGIFEGVPYGEIMSALTEAGRNKNLDTTPVSPCSQEASNEAAPDSTMPTTGMHSKV